MPLSQFLWHQTKPLSHKGQNCLEIRAHEAGGAARPSTHCPVHVMGPGGILQGAGRQ